MTNRRVCCFYDRVAYLPDAAEMITLWTRSWRSFGWETVVLGRKDACAHPLYCQFADHVSTFHSRNIGNYDQLCWLRWLAFAQLGGGVMTDYDVMNRCAIPQEIESAAPTIHEATRVPCMVSANQSGADAIVAAILAAQPPEPRQHFSDMIFFQQSEYPHTPTCVELGHPGWQEAKCVHFSRHSGRIWNQAKRTGIRREDLVRTLIPQ